MKIYFLYLFLLFLPITGVSQFFKKTKNGFELYADSTLQTTLNNTIYENCWCKPIYNSTDSSLLYLTPKKNNTGQFSVQKNGKWGMIDQYGKTTTEFIFDGPIEKRKDGKFLLFQNLKDTSDHLQFQIGSTLTRIDSTLRSDTTLYVMDEYKGSYLVSRDKDIWGIINSDFKILLPLKYLTVYYKMTYFKFNPNGFLALKSDLNKCGVVNHLGKIVVPFNYDWMNDYIWNDNFIFVQNGKKKGYINTSNQIVVPIKYETLPYQLSSKNLVADENYTWFVNEKFVAVSQKYQALEKEGDVYFFKQNYKWGVMDLDMKVIIPNQYTSIEYGPRLKTDPEFKCYYAVKNGKYGLISLTNEIIVPFDYECVCNLSYYSPDNYYIEFKKAGILYRFDHTGKLIEKVAGTGKMCLCEMIE